MFIRSRCRWWSKWELGRTGETQSEEAHACSCIGFEFSVVREPRNGQDGARARPVQSATRDQQGAGGDPGAPRLVDDQRRSFLRTGEDAFLRQKRLLPGAEGLWRAVGDQRRSGQKQKMAGYLDCVRSAQGAEQSGNGGFCQEQRAAFTYHATVHQSGR